MSGLRSMPTFGGRPIAPEPIGEPPLAGPVDEVTRTRLRRLLLGFFGEFPTLDLHLDLLDARGVWYAERALGAWTAAHPDSFFGLVRHVVRTQIAGPAPAPDLEGWLSCGVPEDAPAIAERWRYISTLRYPVSEPRVERPRNETDAAIQAVDMIVARWPEEHWERFVLAYVKLEQVLERRSITLPRFDQ